MFTQIEDASRLAVPTNLSPAWSPSSRPLKLPPP